MGQGAVEELVGHIAMESAVGEVKRAFAGLSLLAATRVLTDATVTSTIRGSVRRDTEETSMMV
jgi:hypothetical protein